MSRLPPSPALDWDEQGVPHARAFGDLYFSKGGGLDETRAVFLAGCGLPERWKDRRCFTIGELGFGTGLNALATWEMWAKTRAPGAVLHFVSVEAFPLERADAARALSAFPEISDRAQRLLDAWPVRARGPQRLWFEDDGFALTLIHAPAEDALAKCVGRFDAWFLDGFAPARNPDLWSPSLMRHIARLSAPDATLATYSVAGDVRRALEEAGFSWEKKEGFGNKKQRLEIRSAGFQPASESRLEAGAPKVAVIGGGIAGAALAQAFSRRGVKPILLEAGSDLASAASGAPAALLMPRLDRGDMPVSRAFLAAYLYAIRAYGDAFASIGVTQKPRDARDAEAFADFAADPPLPADVFQANEDEVFHAGAGIVSPLRAIEAMTRDADVRLNASVSHIEHGEAWRVFDGETLLCEADIVVLACGTGLKRFAQMRWAPLEYSRGQLEWAPMTGEANAVAGGAYAAPFDGGLLFGATFDAMEADASVTEDADSTARNLAALEQIAPELAARIDRTRISSRASVRVAAPDYAPMAGRVPDAAGYAQKYDGLRHGVRMDVSDPPSLPGLYVLGALSARGFLMAPLLAERIACEVLGEPQMLDADALAALDPGRFLLRALRRGLAFEV